MNPQYAQVARRAAHQCEYCHAPEAIFNFPFEVEHVLPKMAGGNDDLANLALCCRACNLYKSDHLNGVDPQTQQKIMLFHPRRDTWQQHFRLVLDSGMILGITPVGRATVARLQMNREMQLKARRQWIRLKLLLE